MCIPNEFSSITSLLYTHSFFQEILFDSYKQTEKGCEILNVTIQFYFMKIL